MIGLFVAISYINLLRILGCHSKNLTVAQRTIGQETDTELSQGKQSQSTIVQSAERSPAILTPWCQITEKAYLKLFKMEEKLCKMFRAKALALLF